MVRLWSTEAWEEEGGLAGGLPSGQSLAGESREGVYPCSCLAAPVDMVAAEFQRQVRLLRTDAADQGGEAGKCLIWKSL